MFYPLFIEMEAKPVLIIGGGKIGLYKAGVLSEGGARLTLMAPERCGGWDGLEVRWQREKYKDQALDGYFLVIAATDDAVLNGEIACSCRRQGILCDDTSRGTGDLIFPAVIREGGFTAALGSNGKTPFLTKKVKGEIQKILAPYDTEIIALLAKTRTFIIENFPAEKEALLQKLAQAPLAEIREKGNPDEISDWLQRE